MKQTPQIFFIQLEKIFHSLGVVEEGLWPVREIDGLVQHVVGAYEGRRHG